MVENFEEFEASDKTSSYGQKPLIRKGYYPARLIGVKPYLDADGNPKLGKFGYQSIFEFEIFKGDSETGEPLEPMMYVPDPEKPTEKKPVVIGLFRYSKYKDQKTGEIRSAVTPKSAITKTFYALGWTFSSGPFSSAKFAGTWCEANIDNYDRESDDGSIQTFSTIKDINAYKGPKPKIAPFKIAEGGATSSAQKPVLTEEMTKKFTEQKEKLDKMLADGDLTPEGYELAVASIKAQLGV